jgi:hypothetical protein
VLVLSVCAGAVALCRLTLLKMCFCCRSSNSGTMSSNSRCTVSPMACANEERREGSEGVDEHGRRRPTRCEAAVAASRRDRVRGGCGRQSRTADWRTTPTACAARGEHERAQAWSLPARPFMRTSACSTINSARHRESTRPEGVRGTALGCRSRVTHWHRAASTARVRRNHVACTRVHSHRAHACGIDLASCGGGVCGR